MANRSQCKGWTRWGLGLLLLSLLGSSCQPQRPPTAEPDSTPTESARAHCVQTYDPEQDYFPAKVQLDQATGFTVEYHNHYKVVTVNQPWKNAVGVSLAEQHRHFQYVLVQCGTPRPNGFEDAQVIDVPIQSVVTLSTTHLPHLEQLDELEALVGVGEFKRVNTQAVRQKIDQGAIEEFNSGTILDLERLLVAEPDLVLAFATGDPETDTYPRLMRAGIPVAIVAEYMEASPLARSEWLKFTALFFNQEAQAQEVFAEIADEYKTMQQLTAALTDRPTVFTGFSYDGTWYMPGGQSYMAQFLQDAGADYLWADTNQAGSLPLDFEVVYDRAATADFWVNVSQNWQTRQDAIAADPRYGEFQAWQQQQVFNNNARLNPSGGNDYWESGISHPHWILADLIKIFHPDLMPDHELVYYQPLQP
ncbi:MAG: ABC transporter substrate-binding protein [Cyanobacteria bacterium P01_G01_bin.54]